MAARGLFEEYCFFSSRGKLTVWIWCAKYMVPIQAVVVKTGPVEMFMKQLRVILRRYSTHRQHYKTQREAFDEMIATLEPGTVLLVCDFQEKFQWGEQDEVQSQHWGKEQVTMFPCPIFFVYDGRVWVYSFQILSDDMSQDNAWVQHVLSKLLSNDIPELLRKIGAAPMTRVVIWSDNCAKQFKCRTHFGWVADSGVKVCAKEGEIDHETPLKIEHHYFGSGHGKNLSDSEGAVAKNLGRKNVINGSWVISDARDLCDKLGADLNFLLRKATTRERQSFEERRRNNRGAGQLLMTKVRKRAHSPLCRNVYVHDFFHCMVYTNAEVDPPEDGFVKLT